MFRVSNCENKKGLTREDEIGFRELEPGEMMSERSRRKKTYAMLLSLNALTAASHVCAMDSGPAARKSAA